MGLTPELQRYYEDRLSMMGERAWRDLMEDVQKMRDATDTIGGIEDLRKLGFRQGEISIMDWLLSLKSISEEAYEELKSDESPS